MSETAQITAAGLPDPPTPFHLRILEAQLRQTPVDSTERLTRTLSGARVDLNPHQIEAAAFALDSIRQGGCLLADEVGLGKTIEAGIVVAQLVCEGKKRILILCPATLRAQWQTELWEKFGLTAEVIDGSSWKNLANPFDRPGPLIASHPFAAGRSSFLVPIPWDLVVIDEAHRLRNAYRPSHKTGNALKAALAGRPKILLTATPLQNDLLELFGLLSFLDEKILGPEESFRDQFVIGPKDGELPGGAGGELKRRLSSVVHRTLRRQVREYVRFTHRRSIVEDFAPSAEEEQLYQDVSEYLRRSEAAGLLPGKRALLTLVYRKLLASSTFAIAPTLRKLAESLEAKLAAQSGFELKLPDEVDAFSEEEEAWAQPEPPVDPAIDSLKKEIEELRQYAQLAERITVNAKGEALKRALDRVFTVAKANQWPQKAVIFTESKRTQDYLFRLLSDHGYQGKISVLSGDRGGLQERAALVEEFKGPSQILLSTEAGAEGLNLQFCNLVVNYDLPWNPQRIEQRIGRCHRYGQMRDVLVINFLNRHNAADARLYDLLEKKLTLFDGVFGASDEILGVLESGLDFERRVLEIYQSCRSPEEIDSGFDRLRADLDQAIQARMIQTRSLLLERFDAEVRSRLKLYGDQARSQLSVWQSAEQTFNQAGAIPASDAKVTYLNLDASGLPPRFGHLTGKEGWWLVYRLRLLGTESHERLCHLVLVRDGDRFNPLDPQVGERFLSLPARVEPKATPAMTPIGSAQEAALERAKAEAIALLVQRNAADLDLARDRADRYAEDCLRGPRKRTEAARAEWERARSAIALGPPEEKDQARHQAIRLEREFRRRLSALRQEEERRYAQKDRALEELTKKAKVVAQHELIASAYFWLR